MSTDDSFRHLADTQGLVAWAGMLIATIDATHGYLARLHSPPESDGGKTGMEA